MSRAASRAVVAAGIAVVAVLAATTSALAACGDTAAARISGTWQVRATVQPPQGTPLFGGPSPGTSALLQMTFSSSCPAAGPCSVQILGNGNGVSFFDNATGLEAPNPDTPLVQDQSGGAGTPNYEVTFRPNGIGGRNLPPCRPPPLIRHLVITVTAATADATGWHATVITGQETKVNGWTCNGSVGVPAGTDVVAFSGVAPGTSFPVPPATAFNPCATAAAATTAGTGTPPAAAVNPDESSISSALASPPQAFHSLGPALVSAAITVGLILFITFPAELFNHTLEENYDDIRSIWERRLPWASRLRHSVERGAWTSHGLFALVLLVGALLGGYLDPAFGLTASSAVTYLAVLLSIVTGIVVVTAVTTAYRRATGKGRSRRFTALPAGLLVAVGCVVVSRLMRFRPGYLYGVVCGVAFIDPLDRRDRGRSVALSAAARLGIAVLAWFAWSPVHDRAGVPGASRGTVLLATFLAAVFVGGIVGTVLSMLPVGFLPGHEVSAWSRAVWAIVAGAALFLLVHVMLRPELAPQPPGRGPLIVTLVLFALFAALSVAFHLYFRARRRRRAAPAAATA